jgi:hypothetical protein
MIRRFLCWIGFHGPHWFGPEWGRCYESFVRECPHCGMRWYGDEIEYTDHHGQACRGVGDWKTRAQCIKEGIWAGDKFEGQTK